MFTQSLSQMSSQRPTPYDMLLRLQSTNPFLPLTEAVFEILSEEIIFFHIPPETKINVSTLADQMHISRTPLKSALSRLEFEGLVLSGKRGYFVAPFNEKEYNDYFLYRAELEADAVKVAAERITAAELKKLKELLKKLNHCYSTGDIPGIVRGEAAFHGFLVSSSGNSLYESAFRDINYQVKRSEFYAAFSEENRRSNAETHELIVRALEYKCPSVAAEAARSHLLSHPASYERDYLKVKGLFEKAREVTME